MSLLAVITERDRAIPLARFALHVARAEGRSLTLLYLEHGQETETVAWDIDEDPPKNAAPVLLEIRDAILTLRPTDTQTPTASETPAVAVDAIPESAATDASMNVAPTQKEPNVQLVQLATESFLDTTLSWIRTQKIQLLIAQRKTKHRSETTILARKLFAVAPCRTLLVRLGNATCEHFQRFLVPTAGGPNSRLALRLAGRLAESQGDGQVTALYIEPPEVELAAEVGESLLNRAVREADFSDNPRLETRVELAEHRDEGIRQVADEGFDLLVIGASRVGVLSRHFFGKVPDHLLSGDSPLVVAVVREGWPWLDRARASLSRWLERAVPQLSRDQRKDLYERLQVGSRWSFDFQLLIALSTAIAALGLLQDSGAVVIGAMLVAPLMTPILGAGLSLVQGNLPLLRTSVRALVGGYLLALGVGFLTGLIFRLPALTSELLARGEPTLLDMGVASLAGFAAAHCLGRPGLIAALPGVAIAAALVPPIATTGICLAQGEMATASGSALLFSTNVVTIVLGAAASLYASGLRGRSSTSHSQLWVRLSYALLFLIAVGLVFPLRSSLVSRLNPARLSEIPAPMIADIDALLDAHPGIQRLSMRRSRLPVAIEVRLLAPTPLSPRLAREIARQVQRHQPGMDVRVRTEIAIDVLAADASADESVEEKPADLQRADDGSTEGGPTDTESADPESGAADSTETETTDDEPPQTMSQDGPTTGRAGGAA